MQPIASNPNDPGFHVDCTLRPNYIDASITWLHQRPFLLKRIEQRDGSDIEGVSLDSLRIGAEEQLVGAIPLEAVLGQPLTLPTARVGMPIKLNFSNHSSRTVVLHLRFVGTEILS